MNNDCETKLPTLLAEETTNTPIIRGMERLLNSLAAAIDRGELSLPHFSL